MKDSTKLAVARLLETGRDVEALQRLAALFPSSISIKRVFAHTYDVRVNRRLFTLEHTEDPPLFMEIPRGHHGKDVPRAEFWAFLQGSLADEMERTDD